MRITTADLEDLQQRAGSRSRGGAVRQSRTGTGDRGGAAPQRERDIQREILDYLAHLPGVYAWKSGAGMFTAEYKGKTRRVRMGKRGVADIIGWRSEQGTPFHRRPLPSVALCGEEKIYGVARFLAIEVKAPGRQLTFEQAAFLARVRAAGGIAIYATSVADVRNGVERVIEPRGNER